MTQEKDSKRGLSTAQRRALKLYCQARSLYFGGQYWALNQVSRTIGLKTPIRYQDVHLLQFIQKGLSELMEEDIRRIEQGFYPASVLTPNLSLGSFLKFPQVILDGLDVALRRTHGQAKVFSPQAREYFEGLPEYYLRNFHFQTDGYLGERSAEVYDYEVDLLFSGATDAMRRLLIAPLKNHFKAASDGKGLKFLEIGPGTGRATRFIKMAFPKAQIVGIDLSEPYLKVARKELSRFEKVSFLQGDGTQLPFRDHEFDAVYSVFLYHELPLEVRHQIIRDSLRVLKPNGVFGFVDSIQLGDVPEQDFFLKEFPKNFHEPFYINYISHPMNSLFKNYPLKSIGQGIGLLSKYELLEVSP